MAMNKITKKEFKEIFTKKNSYFIGVTKSEVPYDKLIQCASSIPFQNIKVRTAKEYSTGLRFNDGSYLELTNNKNTTITIYKVENTNIYVVVQQSISQCYGFEPEYINKFMYYYVL